MSEGSGGRVGPGTPFYKMTGSGNDFVFFDARDAPAALSLAPADIARLCARGTGVGADGLVVLEAPEPGTVRIAYFNSDGSRADLCGNATLCSASLAVRLGVVPPTGFQIATDAGVFGARVGTSGPSFDLAPVRDLRTDAVVPRALGERAVGYAVAGVPHLVVQVDDVSQVDVVGRGSALRPASADRPGGANVNFVSRDGARWRMRTFERGVEGETLACGTGAVACAALVQAWEAGDGAVELVTASGRVLAVEFRASANGIVPTLSGEGRLVFSGVIHSLA